MSCRFEPLGKGPTVAKVGLRVLCLSQVVKVLADAGGLAATQEVVVIGKMVSDRLKALDSETKGSGGTRWQREISDAGRTQLATTKWSPA